MLIIEYTLLRNELLMKNKMYCLSDFYSTLEIGILIICESEGFLAFMNLTHLLKSSQKR